MNGTAGRLARRITHRSAEVTPRAGIRALARAGLVSRAVIYLVLGVLAALIVTRRRPPSQTSGQGALAEIAKQPAGPFLLGLLSAGLAAYGLWRVAQALTGIDRASDDTPSVWQRVGWLFIGGVYFALLGEAISIMSGSGSSGGPSSHPAPYASDVLGWPAGPELLGLIGAGITIGGVALAIWGVLHDYSAELEEDRMSTAARATARVAGGAGNLIRGGFAVAIGIYLLLAADDDAPSRVKSLDELLETVSRSPGGAWWLSVAAAGLFCFAGYSVLDAVYRRV